MRHIIEGRLPMGLVRHDFKDASVQFFVSLFIYFFKKILGFVIKVQQHYFIEKIISLQLFNSNLNISR